MNKKEFIGSELEKQIHKGYDIPRISQWAFHTYQDLIGQLDQDTYNRLESLFCMDLDKQFELSEQELKKIAEDLIFEGQKEELGFPDYSIKEIVQNLGHGWIMCPLCQEAWENVSDYPMLRCPKCRTKLHNTR